MPGRARAGIPLRPGKGGNRNPAWLECCSQLDVEARTAALRADTMAPIMRSNSVPNAAPLAGESNVSSIIDGAVTGCRAAPFLPMSR
ncbi:hypothetical protein RZS08_13225, partial [Arthrospira platensis SPKY1]|nr:hypothetical protein [Arthrospira platensis SPKY1]